MQEYLEEIIERNQQLVELLAIAAEDDEEVDDGEEL